MYLPTREIGRRFGARTAPRRNIAVATCWAVTTTSLDAVATRLDQLLRTSEIPDYPPAVNGVQLENRGPIVRIAVAVDCSMRTIDGAIDAGANLLIVHHGLFWGGVQPIRGPFYERLVPPADE